MAALNSFNEDWKKCRQWLINCKVISNDILVDQVNSSIYELVYMLRDGVLLCHLLHTLRPGSVSFQEFNGRPQSSQFLCLKNIRYFLQVCHTKFDIPQQDLFLAEELYHVTNFGKIIEALSKLSLKYSYYDANHHQIPGFSISRHDESDYTTLADTVSEKEYMNDSIYNTQDEDDDPNGIYGNVVYVEKRSPVAMSKQDYCLVELVDTEKSYLEVLKCLITHFVKPLQKLMLPDNFEKIFFGLQKLEAIHSVFYEELKKADKDMTALAATFLKVKMDFTIYGEYCCKMSQAQALVDSLCEKDPQIKKEISICQSNYNDNKFRLRDLLSVPMQRVLKYSLLLKELIKHTESSADKRNLEQALECTNDLALYVNEVRRDHEMLSSLDEIQRSIVDLQMPSGTTFKDYGHLLMDGELKVKNHEDQKNNPRHIFLFDKVMLHCRTKSGTYNYKDALVLSKCQLEESPRVGPRGSCQFLLNCDNKIFTFSAKTDLSRKSWVDAILLAKDNNCPQGSKGDKFEFLMSTFKEPTSCDVCKKLLRGKFFQGYKCKKTHKQVHKECIAKAVASLQREPLQREHYQARYAYNGTPAPRSGQVALHFSHRDSIELLQKQSENWWEGRNLRTGHQGFFPPSYVVQEGNSDISSGGGTFLARRSSESSSLICSTRWNSEAISPRRNSEAISPVMDDYAAFPWYVGEMDRRPSIARLESCPSGSYLVRKSINRPGDYSLSVKYEQGVKHIKIVTKESPQSNMYYLAECCMKSSLPELIAHYQITSLQFSFNLPTTLRFPYKEVCDGGTGAVPDALGICKAQYDYSAHMPTQLTFKIGDMIEILSKVGEFRGWWKGRLRGKTGYIPSSYVEEITH